MPGAVWQKVSVVSDVPEVYSFNSTGIAIDGGYKVRTKQISIQNMDSTYGLLFSFDTTAYEYLNTGMSYTGDVETDRFYLKCEADATCNFQVVANLKTYR